MEELSTALPDGARALLAAATEGLDPDTALNQDGLGWPIVVKWLRDSPDFALAYKDALHQGRISVPLPEFSRFYPFWPRLLIDAIDLQFDDDGGSRPLLSRAIDTVRDEWGIPLTLPLVYAAKMEGSPTYNHNFAMELQFHLEAPTVVAVKERLESVLTDDELTLEDVIKLVPAMNRYLTQQKSSGLQNKEELKITRREERETVRRKELRAHVTHELNSLGAVKSKLKEIAHVSSDQEPNADLRRLATRYGPDEEGDGEIDDEEIGEEVIEAEVVSEEEGEEVAL